MQVAGTCLWAYCKHMELHVMSIHALNTLGILSINEEQTLLDQYRPCGKRDGNKAGNKAIKSSSSWAYITADHCRLTGKNEEMACEFSQTHVRYKVTWFIVLKFWQLICLILLLLWGTLKKASMCEKVVCSGASFWIKTFLLCNNIRDTLKRQLDFKHSSAQKDADGDGKRTKPLW